ncbi:MAG: hypothetical protein R2738_07605 [Bacteroides graminisolvens]
MRKFDGDKYVKHFTCWNPTACTHVWSIIQQGKFARFDYCPRCSSLQVLSLEWVRTYQNHL